MTDRFVNVQVANNPSTDELFVQGFDSVTSQWVKAAGWTSATENYFPDDSRDPAGHRKNKKSRKMNESEKMAYYQSLLTIEAPLQFVTVK